MNPFHRHHHPETARVGWFAILIVAMLLVCVTGLANAQAATRVTPCNAATPWNAFCVSITSPPATREDGTPVTGALTYRGEYKLSSASTWTSGNFTGTNLYVQNLVAGTYSVRLYAIEAGVSSQASVEQGRTNTAPPPSPPNPPGFVIAQVTVEIVAPAFKVVREHGRTRAGDFVALVPVGRDCSGPVLFRKNGYSFRQVVLTASDSTWQDAGPAPRTAAAPCVRLGG